jgi:hypothetical protein
MQYWPDRSDWDNQARRTIPLVNNQQEHSRTLQPRGKKEKY